MDFRILNDAVLYVSGDDAQSWLQGQTTNHLGELNDEKSLYSLFLNLKGKIVSDVWINRYDSGFLATRFSAGKSCSGTLERYLVMEDVEIATHPWRAVHFLGEVEPDLPHEISRFATSRLDSAGVDLLIHTKNLERCTEKLRTLGHQQCSESEWESRRINARIPRFGKDFDETTLPQEVGLKHAINFEKGCYLGQEPVVMLEHRGQPPRRLALVHVSISLQTDDKRSEEGQIVGKITSVAGQNALALIKRKSLKRTLYVGKQQVEVVALLEEGR